MYRWMSCMWRWNRSLKVEEAHGWDVELEDVELEEVE